MSNAVAQKVDDATALSRAVDDATGLSRGDSRLPLHEFPNQGVQMPRTCPVESHVHCYLAANVNPPRPKAVASGLDG
jgi:hypothetical protein